MIWPKPQKRSRAWEGLGYYHVSEHAKAAQQIMDGFDGQFQIHKETLPNPRAIDPILLVLFLALLWLPEPAVDGNVMRLRPVS